MARYFDASVLVPTVVTEPVSATVDAFLKSCADDWLISDFASAEVASAISRLVRLGQMARVDALVALQDFDAWCVANAARPRVEATDVRDATLHVRRFELMLRTPDALHVAICKRLGAVLVTLDARLAKAAPTLGVTVEVPGAVPGP